MLLATRSKKTAELELDRLEEKWGDKYPIVISSWRNKWDNLSAYFKYPTEIRKIIYTTNVIESVHRQFRKLTNTKGAFPNDINLLKLLFMGIKNANKNGICLLTTGASPSYSLPFSLMAD